MTISQWESLFKILGIIGAGGFFGYRVIAGFINQNLSLTLRCDRKHASSGMDGTDNDYIIATIGIEKGATGALTLAGLEARFKWGEGDDQVKPVVVEVFRLHVTTSASAAAASKTQLRWEPDPERPELYLSPGEKTEFSCYSVVPKGSICKVEVVAFGRRKRSTFLAQWRASAVVPPLEASIAGPAA